MNKVHSSYYSLLLTIIVLNYIVMFRRFYYDMTTDNSVQEQHSRSLPTSTLMRTPMIVSVGATKVNTRI